MAGEQKEALRCKHCGRELEPAKNGVVHDNGMRRCLPWESEQPLGLEAEMA